MSNSDPTYEDTLDTVPARKDWLKRMIIRLVAALCGILMALVFLSEPRVIKQIESGGGQLLKLLGDTGGEVETAKATPKEDSLPPEVKVTKALSGADDDTATQRTLPGVTTVPQSQVPVRRLIGD